jgi:signal transduction histidine kinase
VVITHLSPLVSWALRLVSLAGMVYVAVQATSPGLHGADHVTGLVLTAGTGLGWAGWLVGQQRHRPLLGAASVALLAACGGPMVARSPFGVIVVGVAALHAATLVALLPAAGLAAIGVAGTGVTVAVTGGSPADVLTAGVGALLGLLVGAGRRQRRAELEADAALSVARERSALEHERAELLEERNRIGREVHDLLAHTLSALSVQMTALESLVEDGADLPALRAAVGRSRRLVVEGLDETRRSVRALRDEPVALDTQLAALAEADGAAFQVTGDVRPLPPAAGMALLRIAQEALTNVRRHAPGAPATVSLTYSGSRTRLVVANAAPEGPVAASPVAPGGGYGLQGMRERVELLGGTLVAGPHEGGWTVEAEVGT